jgi:heavy metal sensor kinase
MNRRSVRFRLSAWYAAIVAVVFAVAAIGTWLALRASIHETADKDLRSRLKFVRTFLEGQKVEAEPGPMTDELGELEAAAPAGTNIRIADSKGRWIYRAPSTKGWSPDAPAPADLPARGRTETIVANGTSVRVLSAPVPPGVLQIGIAIDEYYDMLGDFTWTVAFASPLLLLLASAAGYWMSGRALRPVDQITRTARQIGAENLSERLPLRGTGDELDRLSETLNAMLVRLEAAFAKITQFTADASHELRTPVAIMRTTAEVTRSKPRTAEEHTSAWDVIVTQTERTSQLIEDLLLLARADAGFDGLAFESMNLAQTVRDACTEMEPVAAAAGLKLTKSAPSECAMSGDHEAIRRLVLILLDNAIKYTPAGGEIRVDLTEDGPRKAAIEVRDSGGGISADDLPHIFDRFYRASKDRSRSTGGAGLGLSIAHWIATRHGGEILAESTLGAGSVFRVCLHRAD